MLTDQLQRTLATDPNDSFIVQAPAGSGKTEILTQRFLRLLSHVTLPEQIIALTFTKKAANEMRERILRALSLAAANTEAHTPHQKQTLTFAAQALATDQHYNWQLLKQPNRLRVITIDSLCQSLAQAMPLQDNHTPYATITEKPQKHYLAAARACLRFAIHDPDWNQPISVLLAHVDNRQDKLIGLFCDLLMRRDQWLELLYRASEQDKSSYEQALYLIEQHELQRFRQSLPETVKSELVYVVQQFVLIVGNEQAAYQPLSHWQAFDLLNPDIIASLSQVLLTGQNTFRKAFDHHVGLKRGLCRDSDYDALKHDSKVLLAKLADYPDFLPALLRVKNLPAPHYDCQQWEVLQALFAILPLLSAHLQLEFNEHGEVDFTSVAQQAQQALGDEEQPTDLTLYWDNTIHHLLVDEFQDTSIQQFKLLTKLVQGFSPHDGKTVFLVGDPMQSIYRFRAAEVGLFLRAKQQGIGPVPLQFLELSCNFRSAAELVDWINTRFNVIFPQCDDVESGAISFHSASSVKPTTPDNQVIALQYENALEEAHGLAKHVSHLLQTYPTDNIALLVRSRSQLTTIVQVLRQQKIPFQGVDIDHLANLPHLRDVWSITQALLMPGSRLAWLCVLRSPWCGLTLADLHAVANFDKYRSLYYALANLDKITNLSRDGRIRAQFIYAVLHHALSHRHQQSLANWVLQTLKNLNLDSLLSSAEQDDLEQFWMLLNRYEQHGLIDDLAQFAAEFNNLYSQQLVPSRLQIMTIHKSKGLEFDCVMLPSLNSRTAHTDAPLLRWLKLPRLNQDDLLLLSPIKAAEGDNCLLYNYLGKLEAEKSHYELQRLLYVAVTRAKKRLYLFDHSDKPSQGSFRYLLKNQLFSVEPSQLSTNNDNQPVSFPVRNYLPLSFFQQIPELPISLEPAQNSNTNNPIPRLLGIVAHELLQWLCNHHVLAIQEVPWNIAMNQLTAFGLAGNELKAAQQVLTQQISQFMANPIGQWILSIHQDELNEYELLIASDKGPKTQIIDRTFCEQGTRFIIDFKTGTDDPKAQVTHRQQLQQYAEALLVRFKQPIRCGLYYLATNHWVDWDYVEDYIRVEPA